MAQAPRGACGWEPDCVFDAALAPACTGAISPQRLMAS